MSKSLAIVSKFCIDDGSTTCTEKNALAWCCSTLFIFGWSWLWTAIVLFNPCSVDSYRSIDFLCGLWALLPPLSHMCWISPQRQEAETTIPQDNYFLIWWIAETVVLKPFQLLPLWRLGSFLNIPLAPEQQEVPNRRTCIQIVMLILTSTLQTSTSSPQSTPSLTFCLVLSCVVLCCLVLSCVPELGFILGGAHLCLGMEF